MLDVSILRITNGGADSPTNIWFIIGYYQINGNVIINPYNHDIQISVRSSSLYVRSLFLSVFSPFKKLWILLRLIIYIFFSSNDFYILKFGKIDPDEVEIRPRPNSYLHNVQNGEFVEPIEMYIETEQEGVVSHLSQIGPRPRSAR